MPEVKISLRQLSILTALYTIGSAILIIPSSVANIAKQDAWIAALAGLGFGLLILALHHQLSRMYPGANLLQMSEKLLGKWVGKTVNLLFLVTLFLGGPVTVMYDIGSFMIIQILPETPIQAILLLFGAIIVLGIRLGIEVLARSAELLFPWFLLLFLSMTVLLLSIVKWERAMPILEHGTGPIFPAVLSFLSIAYLPHIVLLMFYPSSVARPQDAPKAVYIGSLLGGGVLIIVIALTILVLGPDLAAKSAYPSYMLAQKINIGNFLQRIEAIMAVMWFITLFFRITVYMYAIVTGISQLFNIKNYQPLVLPIGWIMVSLAVFIFPNITFEQDWDNKTWAPYTIIIGIGFPLLLLGVHGVRKMFSKSSGKTS